MKIYQKEIRKRPFDGKWQLLGKIDDTENTYTYVDENQKKVTMIPTKWVVTDVFDFLVDAEEALK